MFSSPSNGTDDLYGTYNGAVLHVSSHHNEQNNIYELRDFKSVTLLKDPAYARLPAIAVVAELLQPHTYVVVCGSDIFEVSGVKITDWRAEIGNSNVCSVYGTIGDEEFWICPFETVDRDNRCWKTVITIPARVRWIHHDHAEWDDSILDDDDD